jgi:serine/threonine protein kinase
MSTRRGLEIGVGDVIGGHWVVDGPLGEGGMGVVVAARHAKTGKPVAIKVLTRSEPGAVQRFEREAMTLAKLATKRAVCIHDFGTLPSGAPYLVMDRLEGETLAQILDRKGPLPLSEALEYVSQAALGLAEAHAVGVVHRDVKPSNLFVTRGEHGPFVVVLDFGLAKPMPIFGTSQPVTATRDILGTAEYIAPEQIESTRTIDARSDVWALGATLYKLLAGVPPFTGDDPAIICKKILHDEPVSLARLRPDLPMAITRIIQRCLEKDPSRRYPTMTALLAHLESPPNESTAPTDPYLRLPDNPPPPIPRSQIATEPRRRAAKRPRKIDAATIVVGLAVVVAITGLFFAIAAMLR